MIAVGWPGQWASSFTRDSGTDLRVRAGQELTHLTLHPGEEVRSPLIGLIVWYEPERVTAGTWLAENHPDWVLGGRNGGSSTLGDPEADPGISPW